MVESEEHERLKHRIGSEYSRKGYSVEYEKSFQGHRWDVVAEGPNETVFIECELFTPSKLSQNPLTHPPNTRALLYVPDWFGKFDALLIDGEQTITANPIIAESKLRVPILASTGSAEMLKREIEGVRAGDASTTSYRISVTARMAFKSVCSALGLDQSPVLEWLVRTFVSTFVGQTKLDLFAYPNLDAAAHLTIVQPQTFNVAIFDKANTLLAKHELERLIDLASTEAAPGEFKREVQIDLARALGKVRRLSAKSTDPELAKLLERAEVVLRE